MSQDKHNNSADERSLEDQLPDEEIQETETTDDPDTESGEGTEEDDQQQLLKELSELRDTHLRLRAEYDNYRKRTMKEKSDLIKYAGEKTVTAFLEVMDDFDLALKNIEAAKTHEGTTEGLQLIQHKLTSTLKSLGVNEMNVVGEDFNPENHDAVAMVPATSDEQKGKIIDCVQKGYTLNDRVLRHPKVVVGN